MNETFTATSQVKCCKCGGNTIPPYTDADGYRYEGYYCDADGILTGEDGAAYTHTPKR